MLCPCQLDAVRQELAAALQGRDACLEQLALSDSASARRILALEAEVAEAVQHTRCVEEKSEAEVEEAVAAVVTQYTSFIEAMREEQAQERLQAQRDLETAKETADSIAAARLEAAEALADAKLAAAGRDHDSAVFQLQQQLQLQLQQQARSLTADGDARVSRVEAEFALERRQLNSALEEAKGDVGKWCAVHAGAHVPNIEFSHRITPPFIMWPLNWSP